MAGLVLIRCATCDLDNWGVVTWKTYGIKTQCFVLKNTTNKEGAQLGISVETTVLAGGDTTGTATPGANKYFSFDWIGGLPGRGN